MMGPLSVVSAFLGTQVWPRSLRPPNGVVMSSRMVPAVSLPESMPLA
jgi:hypothetical protein